MNDSNPAVDSALGAMGISPMDIPTISDELQPSLMSPTPFEPGLVPATPVTKKEIKEILAEASLTKAIPATLRKFGALASMVPGGDRVRIRKRIDGGQLALVNDYVIRDIQTSGDVESFIERYIKPDFGGGEYQVSILDPKAQEFYVGSVNLIGRATSPTGGDSSTSLLREQMHMLQTAWSKPQPAAPDPLDQFQRTQQIMDSIKSTSNDPMIAMMQMQSQSQMQAMQMQMQMAQQQAAQMQAMLAPRQNEQLTQVLAEVTRRLEAIERGAGALPPPPPPSMGTPEMIMAISSALGVLVPLIKGDPGMRPGELVGLIQSAQQNAIATASGDKITMREMLEMMRDDKERQRPAQTLEEQLNMALKIKELAAQFSPPAQQGPQGTNFWDALVTLFGSNDFAAAIGGRIRESTRPQHVALTPSGGEAREALPEHAHAPENGSAGAPPTPQRPAVQIPPGFEIQCKAIEDAKDDAERAQAVVEALMVLHPLDQWRAFVTNLMETIAANDQERALRGMGNWLRVLNENNLIARPACLESLRVFKQYWTIIREGLLEKLPALKAKAPAAPGAPEAPAAPTAPDAPAAPAAPTGPFDVDMPDEYEEEG